VATYCSTDPNHGPALLIITNLDTGAVSSPCAGCAGNPAPAAAAPELNLCTFDPEHGPAALTVTPAGGGESISPCPACLPPFIASTAQGLGYLVSEPEPDSTPDGKPRARRGKATRNATAAPSEPAGDGPGDADEGDGAGGPAEANSGPAVPDPDAAHATLREVTGGLA